MKDEVLRLALEALKTCRIDGDGWSGPDYWFDSEKVGKAITAIKQALEQPEPEPVALNEEWVPCVKLPVVVHVRKQRVGEKHISTREGITPVKPDDLIMRGVAGEEYPIGRELWERTYTTNTIQTKREPLTSGEIYTAYITATNQTLRAQDEKLAFAFARAIEAAHGIKE